MAVQPHEITLNGSHGEGGSALFRTALSVSTLTQIPVRIHNIRGATRKPGITSEDLTFLRALATSCAAKCSGDELGEEVLSYRPTRAPRGLNLRTSVAQWEKGKVPGSAITVLESLVPVLARTGVYSRVTVEGETYNSRVLTYDSFERATLSAHRAQGIYAYPTQQVAGFGYGSKGEVSLEVEPSMPGPLAWAKRGQLIEVRAVIALAQVRSNVGERAVDRLISLFEEREESIEAEIVEVNSRSPGAFVTIWAEFEGGLGCGTAMGEPGLRIERVVERAYSEFADWFDSDATVDPYLADQILLPAALANGETRFSTNHITRRLITMTWVIKQFLPIHITVRGHEDSFGEVEIYRG